MKKALLLVSIAAIMIACDETTEKSYNRQDAMSETITRDNIYVVEIDSCEYIVYNRHVGYSGAGGICHKENCKYCAERKRKGE